MPTVVVDDFSGGVNKIAIEHLAPNECTVCDGFWPLEGNLRSFDGQQILSLGVDFDEPHTVVNHTMFYKTGHAINDSTATTVDGWLVAQEWDATTVSGGCMMVGWVGEAIVAASCITDSSTITVTNVNAHPPRGYVVINGTDLISYTGNNGAGVLSGCSSHPAYASGETAITRWWFPIGRNSLGRAYFATLGGRLYYTCSIGGTVRLMRWDGNFYNVGTASASTTTVTGTGTSWSTASTAVKQGDLIFLNDGSGNWGVTAPQRIIRVASNTSITISASAGTIANGKYAIARVHPMGIAAPLTTGSSLAAGTVASGGMNDGTYYYAITYANAATGFESNPTILGSVTTSGGAGKGKVTITFPTEVSTTRTTDVWSDRWQVDQIKIYRTKVGTTSPYYLVSTTAHTPSASTYLFGTYADQVIDTSLTTTTAPAYNDTPPTVTKIKSSANRIWGWGKSGNENRLYWSSHLNAEYWPANAAPFVSSSTTLYHGGYWDIFPVGQKIMGVEPEGGAYGATGYSGAALLITGEHYARRFLGNDWEEFAVFDAFRETCVASRSLVNCDGLMIWISRKGPVAVQSGSNQVMPLYQKIFPTVARPFRKQVYGNTNSATMDEEIAATFWNGWYVFCYPDANNYNDVTVFLYVPSIQSGNPVYIICEGTTNPITAGSFATWSGGYNNYDLSWGVGTAGGPLSDG